MPQEFEELQEYLEKAMALQAALTMFDWDAETIAPEGGAGCTARVVGVLSAEYFSAMTNPRVRQLAAACREEELDASQRAVLRTLRRRLEELEKIPPEEYRAFRELLARSPVLWKQAKEKNDFAGFAPVLEQVVQTSRRFAALRAKEGQAPYDVLLEDHEEGFPMAVLDPFFQQIKEEIIPLLRRRQEKPLSPAPRRSCPVEKQREFNLWLARYLGFDFARGVVGETEHPFTTSLHNHDVRIATHYYEEDPASGIFSTIHETGHAIYEQQVDDKYNLTLIGGGTSSGMHESQSRFFENNLGRSRAFWSAIYEKLQKMLPEAYGGVPLEEFLQEINRAEPGLIRTEADELTYSLHILIRYELEKQLFDGTLFVSDLPAAWNEKYREYLGVVPASDSEGVLQDIHWAGGMFGYFPSYALGSAIAAQVEAHLRSIMDLDGALRSGSLGGIRSYLKEHLHQYGGEKKTNELLLGMMGEPFQPGYYIQYLKNKFGE
ncbi:MAG TPA: carboxypeptidase M32 [Candidatus Caccousia avistercoris]|nr:carboxypeptidase M32 [Candidatus Caccousia avistercoris]